MRTLMLLFALVACDSRSVTIRADDATHIEASSHKRFVSGEAACIAVTVTSAPIQIPVLVPHPILYVPELEKPPEKP